VTVQSWEFGFNGLIFGGDRAISVETVDGLSEPPVRDSVGLKLADHGALVSAKYMPERRIVFSGSITGAPISGGAGAPSTQAHAYAVALAEALVPRPDGLPLPLVFRMGDGIERVVYCLPTRIAFPVDIGYGLGSIQWMAEFLAGDARIYEWKQRGTLITPGLSLSGLDFGGPGSGLDFGGGSGGFGSAPNIGTISTLPLATIQGPATNPMLQKASTGEFVKVNLSLAGSDSLVIDFNARTIVLNGAASRYYALDPGSTWFGLDPGANTLQFFADGATSMTSVTVTWQSAWAAAI